MVSDTLRSGQILAARQGLSATDVLVAGVMQTIKPRMSLSLCFMKTNVQIPRHTSDACGTNFTDSALLFLRLGQSSQLRLCSRTLLVGVLFSAGTCVLDEVLLPPNESKSL